LLRDWLQSDEENPSMVLLRRFIQAIDTARKDVKTELPLYVLNQLVTGLDLPKSVTGQPQEDELHAASAMALEVARRLGEDMAGPDAWRNIITDLDELRQGNDSLEESVSVLTVHGSKGLEFDYVFIVGVQGDIFPNLKFAEQDPVAMEAERRLFYVGMTRARKSLILSNHARDGIGTRKGPEKDGFIREIPSSLLEF